MTSTAAQEKEKTLAAQPSPPFPLRIENNPEPLEPRISPSPRLRQINVTRALKAAQAVGLVITGYEIDRAAGKLMVKTDTQPKASSSADASYEAWRASHAARQNKGR